MDCIFCKIINGQTPSEKVYEDDHVVAFKDIKPSAPTHILFIPKQHIACLDDISPDGTEVISQIYSAILKFTKKHDLGESGFKVQVNVGKGGGQVVFHIHFHVLSQKKLDL